MKPLRMHPTLLEVNARLWLARLAARGGKPVSLSTIRQTDLDAIAERFDLLWLMGAWRRSPQARERALTTPENIAAYDAALPGWTAVDVDGSPYAVYRYELDPALGVPGELQTFRQRLHDVGVRLIVDFVPNHLAMDHCWTLEHPERFVNGTEALARTRPGQYFPTERGHWIAHGRDPNFPPWSDTAQLNFFSSEAREALVTQVLSIADIADGVRCDMAMLGLSDVFEQVWGGVLPSHRSPRREFWGDLINRVKVAHPGFLFIAEAYWGLETRLLGLGFDYAYDKPLYDVLRRGGAADVKHHLESTGAQLARGVRFIENHDELRAPVAFGRERSQAAAVVVMTLPGLRLIHAGQTDGRCIRMPLQLTREPVEPVDEPMTRFYTRLLSLTNTPAFHNETWQLLEVGPAVLWDESYRHIVAWSWTEKSRHYLVALNHSDTPAQARLCPPPQASWPVTPWADLVDHEQVRPAERCATGVDVHVGPWSARLIGGGPEQ